MMAKEVRQENPPKMNLKNWNKILNITCTVTTVSHNNVNINVKHSSVNESRGGVGFGGEGWK